MSTALALNGSLRNAEAVVDLLVDNGPMTMAEIAEHFGWPRGRVERAVAVARTSVCPDLGLALPSPTPADGWRYQVTTEWQPVEDGAAHQLSQVETRLRNIHRDVVTIMPHLTKGTVAWRRANFLNKHLAHLTGTLQEINNG